MQRNPWCARFAIVADIDPLSQVDSQKVRRAASRDSLFLSATIRRAVEPSHEPVPVRVRNLSSVGMMAEHNDRCLPGDHVTVDIRGIGPVTGKVAWVQNGRVGVSFDVEVDPKRARKPVGPTASRPLQKPFPPL